MGRLASALAVLVLALGALAHADGSKGTIVLTGFEPFGGSHVNPSFEAVKALDGTQVNGYDVVVVRLPVEWKKAPGIIEDAVKRYHPVALVSFGQGVPGEWTLEQVAHNHVDPNLEDNARKKFKDRKIRKDGPDEYRSTLPLDVFEWTLAQESMNPVRSTDPGSYLCEYVFYLDRYYMEKHHVDAPTGFVHVPYASDDVTDWSDWQKGARLVLDSTVSYLDAKSVQTGEPQAPTPTPGLTGAIR